MNPIYETFLAVTRCTLPAGRRRNAEFMAWTSRMVAKYAKATGKRPAQDLAGYVAWVESHNPNAQRRLVA